MPTPESEDDVNYNFSKFSQEKVCSQLAEHQKRLQVMKSSLNEGELDRIQVSNRIRGYNGRFSCQTIQAQILEVDSKVSSLGGRMDSVEGDSVITSGVLDRLSNLETKQNNQTSSFSKDEHVFLGAIAQTCKNNC